MVAWQTILAMTRTGIHVPLQKMIQTYKNGDKYDSIRNVNKNDDIEHFCIKLHFRNYTTCPKITLLHGKSSNNNNNENMELYQLFI
jgi:hypothetical protein